MIVKSHSENQSDILAGIMHLRGISRFDADLTYGNGQFWREIEKPELCFDIAPQQPGTIAANSTQLPLEGASINSAVFDPPFLTYVRSREGNGNMVMARRFAGYWSWDELAEHYIGTLQEAARVIRKGGTLVFKCQDIVHNHRLHCTHAKVMEWAHGFRLADLYVLTAKNRMPAPNRAGTQKHARIHHSYFLVFERL